MKVQRLSNPDDSADRDGNDARNKGAYAGVCNRPSCKNTGATWYSHRVRAHYCPGCAADINSRADDPGRPACEPGEIRQVSDAVDRIFERCLRANGSPSNPPIEDGTRAEIDRLKAGLIGHLQDLITTHRAIPTPTVDLFNFAGRAAGQ